MFGTEIDMLEDKLLESQVMDGKISKKDLNFVLGMKRKMLKLATKQNKRQEQANAIDGRP